MELPRTLGDLRDSGHAALRVKDEIRRNLIDKLSSGESLFPGVMGYDETVIPGLERALLAGHDVILLGERGQAKSRLIRSLKLLLDERSPIVAGCEINDHPYRPVCARCRVLVAERGDDTTVQWIGRDRRYAEKLATPDTSVADLIGDVDPIRVAEGRYLSDELTIHYGLVPRTKRGIFAVNELPDLPERIQVALLNVLEERDVQIRGYKIQLPLDLLLVASANPEDYTHRGRIITPLKDRFGTQVRTHYPATAEEEIAIMNQEAADAPEGVPVEVPDFIKEVIAELTQSLRSSGQVNQRSGVSVRFSIGALETAAAGAVRRAVHTGEGSAVVRPVDLWAVVPAALGRVEFDLLEEGREDEILDIALRASLAEVFRRRLGGADLRPLSALFDQGAVVETSDVTPATELLGQLNGGSAPCAAEIAQALQVDGSNPQALASAFEFVLEGLHLARRINKEVSSAGHRFSGSARGSRERRGYGEGPRRDVG